MWPDRMIMGIVKRKPMIRTISGDKNKREEG